MDCPPFEYRSKKTKRLETRKRLLIAYYFHVKAVLTKTWKTALIKE